VSRATPVQTALRNYTGDEGFPFGFSDQELIPSHRKLLRLKAMVVSVAEKSRQDRETTLQEAIALCASKPDLQARIKAVLEDIREED
jgi:hypothetical protein